MDFIIKNESAKLKILGNFTSTVFHLIYFSATFKLNFTDLAFTVKHQLRVNK